MKPIAKPFYRAALIGFEHALQHSYIEGELDAAQVILSLDFGTEMLLKAVLLDRGLSIMERPKQSIGLQDALKKCGPYANGSAIQVLRERRDSLQHFATYSDANTTRDHYEATMLFVEEVHKQDFGLPLPANLLRKPIRIPVISTAELVSETNVLQRDVHASDSGVVVWAQGVTNSSSLAVHAKLDATSTSFKLTPNDQFEYMPKTDGENVVCYRQSGGVVLYNLESRSRRVISDTGGPTSILGDWVAAQGLEVEDGLGGGIWLWSISSEKWDRISEGGDSARLTEDYVFWQELEGETVNIKYRPLGGGDIKIVIPGGNHPSPDGDRIAWTEWGNDDWLHVTNIDGTEVYKVAGGIFPYLRGDLVAYLKKEEETYALKVDDVVRANNLLSLPWAGFPFGSGPILTHDEVFFESAANRAAHAIWRTTAQVSEGP